VSDGAWLTRSAIPGASVRYALAKGSNLLEPAGVQERNVHGLPWSRMVNSLFNGWRMKDVWLDK
jgi:hypothetical protein